MNTDRAFPTDLFEVEDDTPRVGISLNCWVNSICASAVIWFALLRTIGLL